MDLSNHAVETANPRFTVERLTCQVNLPAGMENPGLARDRIGRIARTNLAGVCGEVLAQLPADGDALYRIRHLHLDLWVDLKGMSEADIARRWGRLLAGSAMRAMARSSPSQVMRFESAQHFVASFLRDLIDGRAWHRWYYEEFKLLEPLSVPRLAVELLLPRPHWIAPTLLELAVSGHAERLIERWDVGDIELLWQALGFPGTALLSSGRAGVLPHDLVQAWNSASLSGGVDGSARARDRLRLWLSLAARNRSQAHDARVAGIIQALVDLAALLRDEPELGPLLLMESEPYPALLRRMAGGPVASVVGWLPGTAATAAGRNALRQVVELVQARVDARPARSRGLPGQADAEAPSALGPPALTSPVAGAFLLAPAMAETGLWGRWLDEAGEEAARRYLFVVALKALGRQRAPLHLGDRLLAAFAGLETPPVADLRRPPQPDGFPGPWVQDLPSLAARWYPVHQRRLRAASVAGIQVLRDEAAGCWLAARPVPDSEAGPLLGHWPGTDVDPDQVQLDLARDELGRMEAEARHLQLGRNLGYPWLTPSLDAALSAVASLVLRRTAARLPRFDQASPAYLASQFLAQPASLRTSPDAWIVQLSGGPLAVVLHLASLPEALEVPWLPLPLRLTLPTRM